jgi:hypothetical protein
MEVFAKGLDMRADRCVWEEFQVFWGVWPPANKRRDATKMRDSAPAMRRPPSSWPSKAPGSQDPSRRCEGSSGAR